MPQDRAELPEIRDGHYAFSEITAARKFVTIRAVSNTTECPSVPVLALDRMRSLRGGEWRGGARRPLARVSIRRIRPRRNLRATVAF